MKRSKKYKGIKCVEAVERAAEKALQKNDFIMHFRLLKIANKLKRGKM